MNRTRLRIMYKFKNKLYTDTGAEIIHSVYTNNHTWKYIVLIMFQLISLVTCNTDNLSMVDLVVSVKFICNLRLCKCICFTFLLTFNLRNIYRFRIKILNAV